MKCLAEDVEVQIDSRTIHSVDDRNYSEPWIWAYEKDSDPQNNVCLYAPGMIDLDAMFRAEIINDKDKS